MIATILISVILAALLGLAVWYMVRTTRRGGCVGCSACSGKQGKGSVSPDPNMGQGRRRFSQESLANFSQRAGFGAT